jgi:hypothetical protein
MGKKMSDDMVLGGGYYTCEKCGFTHFGSTIHHCPEKCLTCGTYLVYGSVCYKCNPPKDVEVEDFLKDEYGDSDIKPYFTEVMAFSCVGIDERLHRCKADESKTLCGINIKNKKPKKRDFETRFSCYECSY